MRPSTTITNIWWIDCTSKTDNSPSSRTCRPSRMTAAAEKSIESLHRQRPERSRRCTCPPTSLSRIRKSLVSTSRPLSSKISHKIIKIRLKKGRITYINNRAPLTRISNLSATATKSKTSDLFLIFHLQPSRTHLFLSRSTLSNSHYLSSLITLHSFLFSCFCVCFYEQAIMSFPAISKK